jgi:hypothetical protein
MNPKMLAQLKSKAVRDRWFEVKNFNHSATDALMIWEYLNMLKHYKCSIIYNRVQYVFYHELRIIVTCIYRLEHIEVITLTSKSACFHILTVFVLSILSFPQN